MLYKSMFTFKIEWNRDIINRKIILVILKKITSSNIQTSTDFSGVTFWYFYGIPRTVCATMGRRRVHTASLSSFGSCCVVACVYNTRHWTLTPSWPSCPISIDWKTTTENLARFKNIEPRCSMYKTELFEVHYSLKLVHTPLKVLLRGF